MSPSELQRCIQSGDIRRAASSLVVTYGSDVLATCIAMLRDRTAAEDVTQEVFGDALRGLSAFRGDSSPRTWLLSIARNRCIDFLRARKRDPWGGALDESEADPDAHPDDGALGSEWLADRSVVMRALDALAEGDRALIVLRFKNGLEYGELATAFGLREGTVRMRVSRALARMREVLENETAPATPVAGSAPAAPAAPAARAPLAAPAPPAAFAMPQAARGSAPGAPPMGGGAFGAARPAQAPASWWSRLRAWAGLDASTEPVAPQPPPSKPVGALGLALAASEPVAPSEALAARLGALVAGL
jgi:RNA polymerase sigma-70 factor (ECF subfamily)